MEWISVKESKPKNIAIVFYKSRYGKNLQCIAFYQNPYEEEALDDADEGWLDYDEEKDVYYYPKGWYECVLNGNDCGNFFIDGEVTHWMKLPEPPKD